MLLVLGAPEMLEHLSRGWNLMLSPRFLVNLETLEQMNKEGSRIMKHKEDISFFSASG